MQAPLENLPCAHIFEQRLLATAVPRAGREPAVAGEIFAERVTAARQTIIDQNSCEHQWQYDRGPNVCDECDEYSRRFTYVCPLCGRNHCAECRFRD